MLLLATDTDTSTSSDVVGVERGRWMEGGYGGAHPETEMLP